MAPLEKRYLRNIRKDLMPQAYGKVLEIGFGNGANMNYYNFEKITDFHALDVNENMKQFDKVSYHILNAEKLPFADESFDTVVVTLALCSIKDQKMAIQEIKRVLKDSGIYLFIEHELPQGKGTKILFEIINPLWRRMANGCQITLKTHQNIIRAGFDIDKKMHSVFHYGVAKKSIITDASDLKQS